MSVIFGFSWYGMDERKQCMYVYTVYIYIDRLYIYIYIDRLYIYMVPPQNLPFLHLYWYLQYFM